ncbi:MAG: PAS domain-containing sensor histidine kinase [Candidatus Cloacimonas sp.]|nr:PAS domain-containing sensor histidine kinase [Candidatus Cloacimonas sp.]
MNPETQLKPIKPSLGIDFPEMVANLMHNLPGLAYRCLYDEQWTMIFLSQGCAEVIGYNSEELLDNNNFSFESLIHTEDREYVRKCVDEAVSRRTKFQMEYRITDKDGNLRWVWEQGNAIYDAHNEARYLDGYIADITSRKNVEEEIKQAAKNLAELNATKDKLFSLIAHDLQNPVYAIITLSDFIVNNKNSFNEQEIGTFLNQISLSAKGIFDLLENLLDWGRIQTGNIVVQQEYVSLPKLINFVVGQFKPSYQEKNIQIQFAQNEEIMVESDSRLLGTILRNLLSNAIKYSHPNSSVKIQIVRDNCQIILSVSDKGMGIGRRDMARLFSINNEIHRLGTLRESGSGLGLVLVKEFADKIGASLQVSSKINRGSTFSVILPDAMAVALDIES